MHPILLMFGITIRSNMMSIYLKSFSTQFPKLYALSDRTLTTWYPLTNFLSKGFLVKFLTKTCVPTLYFGNVLAYLSHFLARWILIRLSSSAWVFQISLNCCKHFNSQFVPVYLCSSSSSFSSASMGPYRRLYSRGYCYYQN